VLLKVGNSYQKNPVCMKLAMLDTITRGIPKG
jgi:hypothetical protein